MSSTLSSFTNFPNYQENSVTTAVSRVIFDGSSVGSGLQDLKVRVDDKATQRNYLWLAVVVILLHIAAVFGYINRDKTSHFVPVKHEVAIEFIKPEVIPPPPVEPPKPPPPLPPKVVKVIPPPQPALRTPVADDVITPNDITVQENTEAPKSTAPVIAVAEPVPLPAPKVEEPVTEATANAAYLNNPAPEYPPTASRMNWGGTVILRVRVLANGSAESVTIKKSSGRKVLDDSATSAVKKWTFVPSKRGSTPIDGWATVPIIFNPEQ